MAPRSIPDPAFPSPSIPPPGRLRLTGWLLTAFCSGGVITVLEMVGFRLYAPYFGYSIYVWGNMISVMLGALAAGYALGGWLADRSRSDGPLYATILACAAYQAVLLFTVWSLLPRLATTGDLAGTVLATLIVFAPPMTGLATVGPFLVRLIARIGNVGSTAGSVYSLSTVGSIAGILAATFFLIPTLGTRATLLTACILSAMVGAVGAAGRRRTVLLALVPVAGLAWAPGPGRSADTVWVAESPYNLVQVRRRGSRVGLVLNHDSLIQSARDEDRVWTYQVFDDFALGPLLAPHRRVLVLGMGGGSSVFATRLTAPESEIDAVEIDPRVVEAARRFFALPPEGDRFRIHTADARAWVTRNPGTWDIVHVDLYQGGPFIPFYLTTVEFFRMVRTRMEPDGLLLMNVLDGSREHELLFAVGATLREVFPAVAVLTKKTGNHTLFASPGPRTAETIRRRLMEVEGPEFLLPLVKGAAAAIVDLVPPASAPVFTDDLAPVEAITRRGLLDTDSWTPPPE
ncbi:MAG: fused MFS/spermidine synthase [Acidobacteria bacterium]|nr:fused MFS/spermidine synthase [Acidobacteriota bacterium]